MPDGTLAEDAHISGPAADIGDNHAELLFLFGEDCFGTGERFQDEVLNIHADAVNAFHQVLYRGEDVLLKIDVQGAAQVKQKVSDAIFVFLAPPGIEHLVQRLNHRGTESPEEREQRTRDACEEMKRLPDYDYVVINYQEKLDQAVKYIKSVIVSERCRVHPRRVRL